MIAALRRRREERKAAEEAAREAEAERDEGLRRNAEEVRWH